MNTLTLLPNSGPLLCSAVELGKALLQTAYFSFFCLCWILLRSSKPSRRLASQSLPPLTPPPQPPPPPACKLFFVLLRDRTRAIEKEQTETENTTYQSFFFTYSTCPIGRLKNPKAFTGSNWPLEKRSHRDIQGKGRQTWQVDSNEESKQALFNKSTWAPRGSLSEAPWLILCHVCHILPALTKLCPYVLKRPG